MVPFSVLFCTVTFVSRKAKTPLRTTEHLLHFVSYPDTAGVTMGIARLCKHAFFAPLLLSPKAEKVGGQAIIEGVMMRSKGKVSWAVQKLSGEVAVEHRPFVSIAKRIRFLGWPVFRGAVSLFESLDLGIKALNRSAELAYEEKSSTEKKELGLRERLAGVATMFAAFGLSIGLFMFLPMSILSWAGFEKNALLFNLGTGAIRVLLFLGYLTVISFWKDVRRVFEYHGAEHKAIFTFEDGKELTLENMRPYHTFHPRCGTSFLLLVTLVSIMFFAIIDSLMTAFVFENGYTLVNRLAVHLALIPLVAGVSYEVLKFSDRYQHVKVVGWLTAPGLWLQRITTKEPDDTQLKIASDALQASL